MTCHRCKRPLLTSPGGLCPSCKRAAGRSRLDELSLSVHEHGRVIARLERLRARAFPVTVELVDAVSAYDAAQERFAEALRRSWP